jgi:hypothetical protein
MSNPNPENPSTPEARLFAVMQEDAAIVRERAARDDAGILMPDGESTHQRRAVRLSPHRDEKRGKGFSR